MHFQFTVYLGTALLYAIGGVPRTNSMILSPSPSPSLPPIDEDPRSKPDADGTDYYRHCNANTECVATSSTDTGLSGGCKGYAGDDCSFPFEICPDATTQCFGKSAVCIGIRIGTSNDDPDGISSSSSSLPQLQQQHRYRCDCRIPSTYSVERAAMMEEFEIEDCENRVTEVCEAGKTTSLYAFCTNGGRCSDLVDEGEPHPGCACPGRFVGRHCEHRRGTAPEYLIEEEAESSPSPPDSSLGMEFQQQQKARMAPWMIAPMVLVSLAAVGGIGFVAQSYPKIQEALFYAEVDESAISIEPTSTVDDYDSSSGLVA